MNTKELHDQYILEHYENSDNERKQDVIEFMMEYNMEFAEFELSLVEHTNEVLVEGDDWVDGEEAIQIWYETLCDELIVITVKGEVVACRFVEYDENDTYFSSRVDDYEIGLKLTFALVDKDHRREGLWTEMYRYVEQYILPKYDECNRFYLATSSENNKMQQNLEENGFNRVSIDKDDRGEGIHTYVYCKIIQ